ncbi:MAG TPA: ABC transporter permease [Gemmatimonadaceae bacterium]|nr:ABC transporter permease [Gemmatimonadaceae bacterium]
MPSSLLTSTARRLGGALVLFWLVLTLTFALVRLAPGDPAAFLIPPTATPADAARVRAALGLDQPLLVQYAHWAADMLRGDLGTSFSLGRPVGSVLREALPVSIGLGAASLLLTFLVGVPLGLLQAAWHGRRADRAITMLSTAVYAAPTFWLALALVAVFTYGAATWGLPPALRLPAFGLRTPGATASGTAALLDVIRHAILPVGILAAVGAAGIARYARASAVELAGEDFIRTARAKGASPRAVTYRHLLRNLWPPLIVLFALALPGVVAGSVFVESVFAWPGMGRVMLSAIAARDYPLVLGATSAYAAIVILANLSAEVLLPIVDPRRAR